MARVLPEWPTKQRRPTACRRYDWDTLLDGQIWEVQPDEYGGDYPAFRAAAEQYVRPFGRIRMWRQDRGVIVMRFIARDTDARKH